MSPDMARKLLPSPFGPAPDSESAAHKEIVMRHAVVWIDGKEARVFEVDGQAITPSIVNAPGPHIHRKAKDQEVRVRNHPDDEHHFFRDVARALEGWEQILLVGPSKAKLHFLRYLQRHEPALEARIVGIETMDHPTDGQLVAHLREYFHESSVRRGVATGGRIG
jgi:stalled ribosome rescue protein Dom34